ncbi:MAG: hypothetical protein R2748_09805 [Bryobacterales bacterium]
MDGDAVRALMEEGGGDMELQDQREDDMSMTRAATVSRARGFVRA